MSAVGDARKRQQEREADTEPVERLRWAAIVLREQSHRALSGPWTSAPHFERRNCKSVFQGPSKNGAYVAMYLSPDTADYIATMHPGVGAALADWLTQEAGRYVLAQEAERAEHLRMMFGPALAVADQILGGEQQ